MKKLSFVLLIAAGILQSCGNNSGGGDSVDSAKDANDMKDTTSTMSTTDTTTKPVDKDVADFAVEAANAGMTEVELGKLAQEKAMNQRVKDFGAMMVQDHTSAGDELKKLATAKNITLPAVAGDDAKKHMDDLSKKSGKDFDKAYMNMMLDGHKDVLKKFQKAASDLKDADIKNFASSTIPTIQKHIDSAMAITGKK